MANEHEMRYWSGGSHWAILTGALAGAVAGYLFGTPSGRRLRDAAVRMLDDFSMECTRLCQVSARALIAVADSWKALEETAAASRHERIH